MSRSVAENEVVNPAHWTSEGGQRRVTIPDCEGCGRLVWSCACEASCIRCHGPMDAQTECGDCHGGAE